MEQQSLSTAVKTLVDAVNVTSSTTVDTIEETNKFSKDLVAFVKSKVRKPFNAGKVFHLISETVSYVKQVGDLSEEERRETAVNVVKEVLSTTDKLSDEQRAKAMLILDTFGDVVVDEVVTFAEDAVTFAIKEAKSLFSCCRKPKGHKVPSSFERALKGVTNGTESTALTRYLDMRLQRPYTEDKLVGLVTSGIKFSQKLSGVMSGSERKDLVIRVVRELIETTPKIDQSQRSEVLQDLDEIASDLIDVLVTEGRKSFIKRQ